MDFDSAGGSSDDAEKNTAVPGQERENPVPSLPPWAAGDIPMDMPNAARMYDYFIGGFHNFAVDRAAADYVISIYPDMPLLMQANRAFLRRAVKFFVQQGIDQILDLGSIVPTVGSAHEVAQQLNPDARVVYADPVPDNVRHSQAILHGNLNTVAFQLDVQHPDGVL